MDIDLFYGVIALMCAVIAYVFRAPLVRIIDRRLVESYPQWYATGLRFLIAFLVMMDIAYLAPKRLLFIDPLLLFDVLPFLSGLFLTPWLLVTFKICMCLLLVPFVIGWWPRCARTVLFVMSVLMYTAATSNGKLDHGGHIVVLLLGACMIHAFLFPRRTHLRESDAALFMLSYAAVAVLYVTSVVSKLASVRQLALWFDGEAFRAALVTKETYVSAVAGAPTQLFTGIEGFFVYHVWASAVAGIILLLIELSALFLPFVSARKRTIIIAGLIVFHVTAIVVLHLVFRQNLYVLGYLLFVSVLHLISPRFSAMMGSARF
ncbi:MAG TPA: hypothetical protein VF438_04165 [Candidatus Paceibacterota bacterium]